MVETQGVVAVAEEAEVEVQAVAEVMAALVEVLAEAMAMWEAVMEREERGEEARALERMIRSMEAVDHLVQGRGAIRQLQAQVRKPSARPLRLQVSCSQLRGQKEEVHPMLLK